MLFSRFENCLDRFLSSPTQVILAFSGGLDSRVMLDLLATYRDVHPQHNYLVVHVHHGLSPNADDWQKRCQAWATEAGFPFVCQRVNLELKGKSLEREAREARYKAISSLMEEGAVVLTGQHADDQVETFMLALKRGSGPAGLASMPERRPMQSGWLLRPLLTVSRADIEDYGEEQGLSWLEDESNTDLRFDRNFLRHQWLPVARTRWPGIDKAIQRTAALCAEQESLLDEVLSQFDNALFADDGALLLSPLTGKSENMVNALIRRWFKISNVPVPSQAQLTQVKSTVIDAAKDANPLLHLSGHQLRRYHDRLYLLREMQDISHWQGTLIPHQTLMLPDGLGHLNLIQPDGSELLMRAPAADETITVSFNPEGLFARPLGRQGKRKLKKLFQEYGVPSWNRRRTPIIFYNSELAAVAGLFVCQGFEGKELALLLLSD